jgi:hypothetical protein
MTPIQLVLAALADFARGRGQDDIAGYLDLIGTIAEATKDDKEKFAELTAEIQAMVDAGRDPTPEERQSVRDRRKELSDQIRDLPTD